MSEKNNLALMLDEKLQVDRNTARLASLLLLTVILVSGYLVLRYVDAEKKRDLQHWRQQLNIVVESRKTNIESWLSSTRKQLASLAENPLVQLHVADSQSSATTTSEARRGQFHHLKNLLSASAHMQGVFTPASTLSSNQTFLVNDGLALADAGRILLATRFFPADDPDVLRVARSVIEQRETFVAKIYRNQAGQPRLILAVPVRPVQAVRGAGYNGAVIAVVDVGKTLYPILKKNWLAADSAVSVLVRRSEQAVTALSPLDGEQGVFSQRSVDDTDDALVYGMLNPGGFAIKAGLTGQEVLVVSRQIDMVDWVLVDIIDTMEALQESRSHQRFVMVILLLVIVLVAIAFIAIWRHATSLRLQRISRRLAARTELLNAVGNSIKDSLFLLDTENTLVLINMALADFLGISVDDVKGRHLSHLYETDTANRLLAVAEGGDVRNVELRIPVNGKRYDYHVTVVSLQEGAYERSRLFLLHDITHLKDSQYRHQRLLESVIRTVVRLTDIHDPHCEKHSERTREVAVAIGRAMALSQDRLDALAMAAQLANIGKLCVPGELLTSDGALTDEQTEMLKRSNQYSVELIEGLDFEGPVVEIVRQKNEYLDGSGYPSGLRGDEILLESRILAVANAFVAMSSARAYRPGKTLDEVMNILLSLADTHYDRKVVATLFYVVEKNGVWRDWSR